MPESFTIPPGWKLELLRARPEQWLLTSPAPRVGAVTLDFERRGYRLGFVRHGKLATDKAYVGRGWKQELVDDAVAALTTATKGTR